MRAGTSATPSTHGESVMPPTRARKAAAAKKAPAQKKAPAKSAPAKRAPATKKAPAAQPLPFTTDEANDYEWTKQAYDLLKAGRLRPDVSASKDGIRTLELSGECPRCHHDPAYSQVLDAVAGEDDSTFLPTADAVRGRTLAVKLRLRPRRDPEPSPQKFDIVASCQCDAKHPRRPDGVTTGCGANFRLKFTG